MFEYFIQQDITPSIVWTCLFKNPIASDAMLHNTQVHAAWHAAYIDGPPRAPCNLICLEVNKRTSMSWASGVRDTHGNFLL